MCVLVMACGATAGVTDGSGGTIGGSSGGLVLGCTLIGCQDGITFESNQLVPGQQYTISVCLNNRCSTMTTTAEFLDPAGSTDSTVVDPDRPTQPFVRIAVVLLDVADTVDLDLTIEAVEDRGVIYEASGPVTFTASYPNGIDCPPPCWGATITF